VRWEPRNHPFRSVRPDLHKPLESYKCSVSSSIDYSDIHGCPRIRKRRMATGTASVHLVPATMNLVGTNIGALLGWPVPTKLQVPALFKGARDTYIRVLSSTTGDSIRHKTEKSGNFPFERRKKQGDTAEV